MTREGGGESPLLEIADEFDTDTKERTYLGFAGGTKLDRDYVNAFFALSGQAELEDFATMHVVPLYGEYHALTYPKDARVIMRHSDPEAVTRLNQLVTHFNADLDRIKKEKDKKAVDDFISKVMELLGEKGS